ncbi:MAG: replicative DNA helicase [Clostridia bacterium]|nr:replicative DNA helicase [Clostridia bacterium]
MAKTKDNDVRMMPHSVEGEQSVLGCALIDDDAAANIVSDLKADDFYVEAHKIIFDAMFNIVVNRNPVDLITLTDELSKKDMLDSVGGMDYITSLTNIVPSASNYEHYVEIVKRDSVLRKLIGASKDIINKAYEGMDKNEAITFAESNIFTIAETEERSNLTPIKEDLDSVIEKFEIIQKDRNSLRGIATGLYGLDKITNGLQNSDLILIAARPGCGKTSLAMNIVNYAAIQGKKKVAVFSLEMPKKQLAMRSLCSVAYVSMTKANKGELGVKEWQALWGAKEKLANADIYVDDSSLNKPMDILHKCEKLKREKGLDLIMIDYLQLMASDRKSRDANRQAEISEITRSLKIAARELDVPIILLSQLSRAPEQRKGDHKPQLSDLRESGAIEQDADIVLFIYRPDLYNDVPDTEKQGNLATIIVAKHRNGPIGEILVKWLPDTTTFVNLGKDADKMSLESGAPAPESREVPMPDVKYVVPFVESDFDDIF